MIAPPWVTFEGGENYPLENDGLGEGVLRALAADLKRRGVTIHDLGPGRHHPMVCVLEIDGHGVQLSIMPATARDPWAIVVQSVDGAVPPLVIAAVPSLTELRNIRWHEGDAPDGT